MASLKACGNFLLISCGENVAVVDFSCPNDVSILSLPDTNGLPSKQKQKTKKVQPGDNEQPNRVLATAVSKDGCHVALCDDRKYLHVFQNGDKDGNDLQRMEDGDGSKTSQWNLASSRLVSRRCTVVQFTSDHQTILVADKSGDVFSFPTTPLQQSTSPSSNAAASTETASSSSSLVTAAESNNVSLDAETGEQIADTPMEVDTAADGDDNRNGDDDSGCGQLVLGHLSMLLDMVLIDGDKFVVTADRDEKIRISSYPDSYNIHGYCLGHTAFVISLACNDTKKILFSGSGDSCLGIWGYDGHLINMTNCVEDFPQITKNPDGETKQEEVSETEEGQDGKQAVQQIAYSPDSDLLFVVLYKCPDILVYRLDSSSEEHNRMRHCLHPVKTHSTAATPASTAIDTTTNTASMTDGSVVSVCITGSTLWVLREAGWPKLQLEAVSFDTKEGVTMTKTIDKTGDSKECQILQAVSAHKQFQLEAPSAWQDPIPTLWKSQVDGYIQEYMERKRQRVEGEGGGGERWGNKKRKGKKGKKWAKKNEGKEQKER